MAVGTSPYDAGGAGGLVDRADPRADRRRRTGAARRPRRPARARGRPDADRHGGRRRRSDRASRTTSGPTSRSSTSRCRPAAAPRAAREIARCSPDTRVIALSAFEDRPTVLEMLRAGAVGYLVKGTGGEEIVGSIQKVMAGGASLSTEVIAGIVSELTKQLRREDDEREQLDARRAEIAAVRRRRWRLDGVPADRRPHDRRHGGTRSARALLHASAPATQRVVRRGGVTGARRAAGADHR